MVSNLVKEPPDCEHCKGGRQPPMQNEIHALTDISEGGDQYKPNLLLQGRHVTLAGDLYTGATKTNQ